MRFDRSLVKNITMYAGLCFLVALSACSNEVPELKQQIMFQDSIIAASQQEQEALLSKYDQTFEELKIIASGGIPRKNPSETDEQYADVLNERQFTINNFKNDLVNLRSQLDDAKSQFEQAQRTIRTLKAENNELISKNKELSDMLNQKFKEIETLNQRYQIAEERLQKLQGENQELKAQVEQMESELTDLRSEYNVAMEDLKSFYTAYYTIGTRVGLKRTEVIKIRGIGKPEKTAKLNYNGLREKMTAFDKRERTEFIVPDAKVKNITLLPLRSDSTYTVEKWEEKSVKITITDQDAFWQNSNYLVIIY